jgi:putative ABC transport system permease protein
MKYIYKQLWKSLLSTKINIIILFLLSLLTSFMYFFIQVSIDGNIRILISKQSNHILLTNNEKELFTSLESNQVLAICFLIILSLITAFIFSIFYKKYMNLHMKEFGCYVALGYSELQIIILLVTIGIAFTCFTYVVGLLFGWIGSAIMLNLYATTYPVDFLTKGISLRNCITGFNFIVLLPAFMEVLVLKGIIKPDIATMLNGEDINGSGKKLESKLLCFIPKGYRSSIRTALRKPFNIFLVFLSVALFSVLFILSISLNLSSKYIYNMQTAGRTYQYDVAFADYQAGDKKNYQAVDKKNIDSTVYLTSSAVISFQGKKLEQKVISFDLNNDYMQLFTKKRQQISSIRDNQIVINTALSELFGIQKKDDVILSIGNKSISFEVAEIAENADLNTIYCLNSDLEKMLELSPGAYNGMFTNDISGLSVDSGYTVISAEERLIQLDNNNVSNRISAIICQVLGCIIGCLLIYLTILLNFQEHTRNILILDMLGYPAKKINKMFISVYHPIMNIAFLLFLIPSIKICESIQKNLSIETNDYFPFRTNIPSVFGIWVLLNVIYLFIRFRFNKKIWYIQCNEEVAKYM